MGASSTPLSGTDLAYRTANKPMLIGRNSIQLVSAIANLVTNTAGSIATGDQSGASHDRKYLIDRFRHTWWLAGSSNTTWYICADLGVSPPAWDALIIDAGHNLDTCTITVEGDDAVTPPVGAWAGATTIVNAVAVSGNQIFLNLQGVNQWTPRFVRIKIVRGGAFIPLIPQLWLAHSVQLPCKSNLTSNPATVLASDNIENKTGSGILWNYQLAPSAADRTQEFTFAESDSGAKLTELRDLYKNVNALRGGSKGLWYIEDPTANPGGIIYCVPKDKIFVPRPRNDGGNQVTDWTFSYVEQGGALA